MRHVKRGEPMSGGDGEWVAYPVPPDARAAYVTAAELVDRAPLHRIRRFLVAQHAMTSGLRIRLRRARN